MLTNRFDNDEFGIREIRKIHLHANKFVAEQELNSLDDVKKILAVNHDAYKLEIIRTVERYNLRTGFATHILEIEKFPIWVADEISNANKIKNSEPFARFEPQITDKNMYVPGIQTGRHTQYSIGLRKNMYTAVKKVPVSTTVTWKELTDKDIVIDRNAKQIYPQVTAKAPELLSRFLQNVR